MEGVTRATDRGGNDTVGWACASTVKSGIELAFCAFGMLRCNGLAIPLHSGRPGPTHSRHLHLDSRPYNFASECPVEGVSTPAVVVDGHVSGGRAGRCDMHESHIGEAGWHSPSTAGATPAHDW